MLKKLMMIALVISMPSMAQKVVENGENAEGQGKIIEFTEELRFGAEETDDHYLWGGQGCMVTQDSDKNIYVTDVAENRVLAFDENGKFKEVFGPNGSGPGEYQGAPSFFAFRKGGGFGLDVVPNSMPRAYIYNEDLEYKETITPTMADAIPIALFSFSPDGNLLGGFALKIKPADGKMVFFSGVMDRSFKFKEIIMEMERDLPDQTRLTDPGYWEDFLAQNFRGLSQGTGHVAFDQKGNIFTSKGLKYEITKWSPDMSKKLIVIHKKYKPLPMEQADVDGIVDVAMEQIRGNPFLNQIVTEAVVRKAIDKADMPPMKNPIYGLISTDDGHLLAVRDLGMADGKQLVDLFSPEGEYLGSFSMKGGPFYDFIGNRPRMTFYGDRALTTIVTEEGDVQVVRYKWKLVNAK